MTTSITAVLCQIDMLSWSFITGYFSIGQLCRHFFLLSYTRLSCTLLRILIQFWLLLFAVRWFWCLHIRFGTPQLRTRLCGLSLASLRDRVLSLCRWDLANLPQQLVKVTGIVLLWCRWGTYWLLLAPARASSGTTAAQNCSSPRCRLHLRTSLCCSGRRGFARGGGLAKQFCKLAIKACLQQRGLGLLAEALDVTELPRCRDERLRHFSSSRGRSQGWRSCSCSDRSGWGGGGPPPPTP
mmetsp:Transcript_50574/g.94723  ORF Transcript_50574/g.94723 Transcript_50574/m.94723 type:complete len:240 (+) Transcript_50574:496-1215(+)